MKQTFKKLTAVFVAAALAVTCLPLTVIAESLPQEEIFAAGDKGTYQGFDYKELEDGTLSITGYNGSNNVLTIPSEIGGKKVTAIDDNAFYSSTCIVIVTIPDSVTTIGEKAFAFCRLLAQINIPDSVTTIGDKAFAYCDSLIEINVDENNKNFCSVDGILFNKDMSTLILFPCKNGYISYSVPDSVTTIEELAFDSCQSLKSVYFPDGLTTIGERAFHFCQFLKEITIPESVTSIGALAFMDAFALTEINVDENNKNYRSIDGVLFNKDITTLIQFPCRKDATSYTIPDGVTTIEENALWSCDLLTKINLPDSVTTIGGWAFASCILLTEITFPKNVTTIGEGLFNGCSSLAAINVDENNKNFSSIDGVWFNKDATTLIKFPCGKKVTSYEIPDGVTTIKKDSFDNCDSLTVIHLPDSVTTIEDYAFSCCYSLTEINIPDGVKKLGIWTFIYCSMMKEITIPASVTEIHYDAFFGCDDLTICGYAGTYAETYAYENNFKFVPLNNFADKETGIEIIAGEDRLPADAKLNIEQTEHTDTSFAYNITFTKDGKDIQPEGKVTVRIPVPDGWSGKEIHVYYTDTDGDLTDMHAFGSGGYVVFTTDHFSEYIVTTEKLIKDPGDVNGDGEVGELDCVELARYLANWNVTIDKDAADLDGDGEVGETDSVILARRLAGWNV